MALRNTARHQDEPGQIVSFLYKGQDSNRAVKRTILVINPNLRYRKKSTKRTKSFVVGLQLDTAITPPITESKLENLFGKIGGLEIEEGAIAGDLKDRLSKAETVKLTGRLRPFYKYLRTYSLAEARRNRVYLEVDYMRIPKDTMDKFDAEVLREYEELFF